MSDRREDCSLPCLWQGWDLAAALVCDGVSISCIFQEAEAGKDLAYITQTPFLGAPLVSPAFASLALCLL